ncbi:hypothetical protein BDP55DRAFT_414963 [Colletotrichum godetiae]|uniref:Secreted protein n=1 Tax=Colletotrichum godetiae TaxID=1209918 RepID=A0AAJ0AAB7_9PEZI|nr:uncharacterized protein BDP55DRAFT_414963 [Colletotrichum godetiae]KAK1657986.1 hypothetical protein BDP55DRAFT_414963 [Colletotrichum godetiae]
MTLCFRLFVLAVPPSLSVLRTTSFYVFFIPVHKRPRLYAVSVAKRQNGVRYGYRPRPRPIPCQPVASHATFLGRPLTVDQCSIRYGRETTTPYHQDGDLQLPTKVSSRTLVCGPAVRHNDGRMLRRTGRAAR